MIRECQREDFDAILTVINQAAEAYRVFAAPMRWTEPYMPADALHDEIAAGVRFFGYETGGHLVAVMGSQHVKDVRLIRHSYVLPAWQRRGIGGTLLEKVHAPTNTPILVGTWAAASWAIRFYEKHGFRLVTENQRESLLRSYWSVPEQQIAASVVLANSKWQALEVVRRSGA